LQVDDCGWRYPKRMASVGVAESDTCAVALCNDTQCAGCIDYSDDMFPSITDVTMDQEGPTRGLCGRGTQTRRCKELQDASILKMYENESPRHPKDAWIYHDTGVTSADELTNTYLYNNVRYHEKTLYVNGATIGQPCKPPTNFFTNPINDSDHRLYQPYSLLGSVPWFSEADTLAENMALVPQRVCSDGGQGSVRLPLRVPSAKDKNFFLFDFICPYGSQPGVCPDRDLAQFREVQDEMEQPSGPEFGNCHDGAVPDFECCKAENAFRVHGGGGVQANMDLDDLRSCALPNIVAHQMPDTGEIVTYRRIQHANYQTLLWGVTSGGTNPHDPRLTVEMCIQACEESTSDPSCVAFVFTPGAVANTRCALHTSGSSVTIREVGTEAVSSDVYEKIEGTLPCPVHYTSYHHTSTGCEAYCAIAFQREGNDNTCMPSNPECANWHDAAHFPAEEHVTVTAWCICGAKLPKLMDAGQYVQPGTILDRHQPRALRDAPHAEANGTAGVAARGRGLNPENVQNPQGAQPPPVQTPQGAPPPPVQTPQNSMGSPESVQNPQGAQPPPVQTPQGAPPPPVQTLQGAPPPPVQTLQGAPPPPPLAEEAEEAAEAEDGSSPGVGATGPEGVSQHHGAHFTVPNRCFAAILDFRTVLNLENATKEVVNYFAGPTSANSFAGDSQPTAWEHLQQNGYDPPASMDQSACNTLDGTAASDEECCVASRGTADASRVWLQRGEGGDPIAFAESRIVGTAVHTSEVSAVGNFDDDDVPDIVVGNRLYLSSASAQFEYAPGVPIGPRDFAQVYAGDIDGTSPDDIVAVYDDGAVEVFLTIHDPTSPWLARSGGVGFHSMGIVLAAGVAKVTTANFIGTLNGHATNCRGRDFGCVSSERAVFLGTEDTDDYLFVSPQASSRSAATHREGHPKMEFSVEFAPLANSKHRTLASARFFADYDMTHQALAIATGAESPNSLAYLGFRGFKERNLGGSAFHEESVAVAAARVQTGVNLICFANRRASNRCHRYELDPDSAQSNRIIDDLAVSFPNPPPFPPFLPPPSPPQPSPPPPLLPPQLPSPSPPPPSYCGNYFPTSDCASVERLIMCGYHYDQQLGWLCTAVTRCAEQQIRPPTQIGGDYTHVCVRYESTCTMGAITHCSDVESGSSGRRLASLTDDVVAHERDTHTYDAPFRRTMHTFGAAEDDTADIKIAFFNSDARADIVTVSEVDHVRIYLGTDDSQYTGDYGGIDPNYINEIAPSLSPPPPTGRAKQIFVADFNNDSLLDLFVHSPARSPGSCATRCHSLDRFGYDTYTVHHVAAAALAPADRHEPSFCYCGPTLRKDAPHPPPSPPKPPPSPCSPPSLPPIASPGAPPPSPPFP
jgi:hypothetical protein